MDEIQIKKLDEIAHQYLSHTDRNVRLLAIAIIAFCDREKKNAINN